MVKLRELFHKGSGMRLSSPSPDYHEGRAWGSHLAVWAEAWTPQPTSFPGRLTKARTLKVTIRQRRQVGRLTMGLTVADRWEFASCNWAFSLALSGSQPQAQSQTHRITGKICS